MFWTQPTFSALPLAVFFYATSPLARLFAFHIFVEVFFLVTAVLASSSALHTLPGTILCVVILLLRLLFYAFIPLVLVSGISHLFASLFTLWPSWQPLLDYLILSYMQHISHFLFSSASPPHAFFELWFTTEPSCLKMLFFSEFPSSLTTSFSYRWVSSWPSQLHLSHANIDRKPIFISLVFHPFAFWALLALLRASELYKPLPREVFVFTIPCVWGCRLQMQLRWSRLIVSY